jgi:type IV secretion system protein ptlE homolog
MFGKKKFQQEKEKPLNERNAFDWEDSHIQSIERSEKRAWTVAFLFAGCFTLSVIGIAMMLPLKETLPYVVRVDKATGAVDLVTSLRGQDVTFDEVQDRYWITRYVRARESYDWSLIANDYLATKEFSSDIVFKPYEDLYSSAKSPEKIHKAEESVKVNIISVTINQEEQTATVRFNKTVVVRKTGGVLRSSNWIATLRYSYDPKILKTTEMRDINPFGFTVEQYQADPEADQVPLTVSGSSTPAAPDDTNSSPQQ